VLWLIRLRRSSRSTEGGIGSPDSILVRLPIARVFCIRFSAPSRPASWPASAIASRSFGISVALFAYGHFFRVFAARWIGFPPAAGCHFLLDTATISVMSYYQGIPAFKRCNRSGPA